jgi:hypothetical protein
MATTFAKPRLVRAYKGELTEQTLGLSDHNRKDLQISTDRIEKSQRMANGRLRKYYVADKRTFSTSWDMLPGPTVNTVDGQWGADAIEEFYMNTPGAFTLELTFSDRVETYNVMFSDFSKTLQKRGVYDFYNVSIEMEQV